MNTPQLPDSSYDTQDTARLAFMLKLVDTLHSMPDLCAMEEVACRMLAEHLHVGFAWFGEIGPDRRQVAIRSMFIRNASGGLAGIHTPAQMQTLGKLVCAEQPYIIDDAFHSHMRSCMAFPVAKGKQTLTYIAVAHEDPHHWTAREVSVVHETAVRAGVAFRRTTTAHGQPLKRQFEVLQHERVCLMQRLHAQVERLHKLMRDLLDTTSIAEGRSVLSQKEEAHPDR